MVPSIVGSMFTSISLLLSASFSSLSSFSQSSQSSQSSTLISSDVRGPGPLFIEDPEALEKPFRDVSKLSFVMISVSCALLNINAFNSNPITKIPLMIATTTALFAVILLALTSLRVFGSPPLGLLVAFLVVSLFAIVFALVAHSWSETNCTPPCAVERALVSTAVIGGAAALMISGWRMRGGHSRQRWHQSIGADESVRDRGPRQNDI